MRSKGTSLGNLFPGHDAPVLLSCNKVSSQALQTSRQGGEPTQQLTLGMSSRSEGTSIRKSPWFMMLRYSSRGRRSVLRSTGSSPICAGLTVAHLAFVHAVQDMRSVYCGSMCMLTVFS